MGVRKWIVGHLRGAEVALLAWNLERFGAVEKQPGAWTVEQPISGPWAYFRPVSDLMKS